MQRQQSEGKQRDRIDKHIKCLTRNDDSVNKDTLIHSLQLLRDEVLDDQFYISSESDSDN